MISNKEKKAIQERCDKANALESAYSKYDTGICYFDWEDIDNVLRIDTPRLLDEIDRLHAELAQTRKERDKAIKDLHIGRSCHTCIHFLKVHGDSFIGCLDTSKKEKWQWRGAADGEDVD